MARVVWILIGLMAGCGEEPADAPAPAAPRVAKIGEREIDVIVNGDKLAILTPRELRDGVRLDELLANQPYVQWKAIAAYGPGVGPIEWTDPVMTHAGKAPVAFLDGDRGALALVEPGHPPDRAGVADRADGIDEIRITIPKPPRTPLQDLAAGCVPPPKGEAPQPATAKRWRGSSYQFNIPMHWRSDFTIDFGSLVDKPVGSRVGTLVGSAVEWDQVCHADLFRIADRNGRRAVIGRVRPGEPCVDAIMEFACDGKVMQEWAYYASNGEYVEHGTIAPVP